MLSHDDPRLTRYALGEMNDEERTAFEREMTEADRAEIESIRALAGTLTGALALEPKRTPAATPPRRMIGPRTRWILAAAASVAVVGLVGASMWPASHNGMTGEGVMPLGIALHKYSNENRAASQSLDAAAGKKLHATESLRFAPAESPRVANGPVAPNEGYIERPTRIVDESKNSERTVAHEVQPRPQILDANLRSVAVPGNIREATPALVPLDDQRIDRRGTEAPTADSYAKIRENPFLDPRVAPLSTFGIDVDTASYANVRRFLTNGTLPPADAVRVEELINYFPTTDAPPSDGRPFATYAEVARCPWNASRQLVRVALKAREVAVDKRPPSNLVFLVDVSGSMNSPDRLPLVKRGLQRLVERLGENDRVAIVVYAGNSGLALPSTNAENKDAIRRAIDHLEAGGSTNGGQGIELAYRVAQSNFVAGGANRVVLCTDGDFNVGVTDRGQLTSMVVERAKAGVFLSVLGFGRGNLKDDTMESLADKGNGNYAYIDSDREAQKVLVEQASGTLVAVAKDVKIQIEFNPAAVRSYRLIGYENRLLAKEDFNNDLKDAGEIGAGHSVVALYEIEPTTDGRARFSGPVDALKYQPMSATTTVAPDATELLTLKLRYKAPDAPLEQGTSELIERTLPASDRSIDQASPDFQFAAAVAGFGMMLRGSAARGDCDWPTVARLAKAGLGADVGGHRAEFVTLVDRASSLAK